MTKLTFGYMRDYLSAKGLTLEGCIHKEHGIHYKYRIGNTFGPWTYFINLDEVKEHLKAFH